MKLFTCSVLTIHTTYVQEPVRKNVGTSGCRVWLGTHVCYMVQARKAEESVNEN